MKAEAKTLTRKFNRMTITEEDCWLSLFFMAV